MARLVGYEKLPDTPPKTFAYMHARPEELRSVHTLRRQLANLGYQELINFSFVPREWEKDFAGNDHPIELLNPIASQLSVMRTQMVGGLVDILKYNLNRKVTSAKLFEVGRIFRRDDSVVTTEHSVKGVDQPVRIAGLLYGDAMGEQWAVPSRLVDFFDAKGDVERLIAPLKATFVAKTFPALHPGRSAAIMFDGKEIGFVGELHPKLQQTYGLPHAPMLFEVDVASILKKDVPWHTPVSKFQPITRDVSVVVPQGLTYEALQEAVAKAAQSDRRLAGFVCLELFDLYHKKAEGDKPEETSMAFRMTIQPEDENYSGDDAEGALQALVEVLAAQGAVLRQ